MQIARKAAAKLFSCRVELPMIKKATFAFAMLVVLAIAAVVLPAFIRARNTPARNGCVNNLRILEGAKEQWSLENHKGTNDVVTWGDVLPYLRNKPACPQGGTYLLGRVGELPRCSFGGAHTLSL